MALKQKVVAMLLLAVLFIFALAPASLAQRNHMEHNDYVAYLKKHVESGVMEPWQGERPMASFEDIDKYLQVFDYWSQMALEGDRYKLAEKEQVLLASFKDNVSKIQNDVFPQLRKALENVDITVLGVNEVVIHTEGDRSRTAVFVSSTGNEANPESFFDKNLVQIIQRLRFEQARHKAQDKQGSHVETLLLQSFADSDLVAINPNTNKYRVVK